MTDDWLEDLRGQAGLRRRLRLLPGRLRPTVGTATDATPEAGPAPSGPPETRVTAFVMLATLTPPGIRTVKSNPERINAVSREAERLGITVGQQWAMPGEFDFLSIAKASDERAMLPLALELGSRGSAHCRSLAAIPIDESVASP